MEGSNEYILPASIFQDNGFELTNETFIDEKPVFYELKNETHKLTDPQVFAQSVPRVSELVFISAAKQQKEGRCNV